MMRFKSMLDGLVEFLVTASRLGCIEIATAYNTTVCCLEVERICNIVEFAEWKVLGRRLASCLT